MLRARAARRSCRLHGDNGCEQQGAAGVRTRAQEARLWRRDAVELMEPEPVMGDSVMEGRGEMPKENINGDLVEDGVPASRVEVSWAADAYVQLTTGLREGAPSSPDSPAQVGYNTGAYVSLDRYGINRLIQVLRRARNAAYGRDE